MSRFRFTLALLLATSIGAAPALAGPGAGLFKGKKTDPTKVPALIETLKNDPDEKKRKSAAEELGRADAKQMPEIVTALVSAIQKDASSGVRSEAADAIGQLGAVFPTAGLALEVAASGDSSALVRLAAKKSLWEYHLNGYRSPKGGDGFAVQTMEPPIASPAAPRTASAVLPPVPSITPLVPLVPQLPTAAPTSIATLPQVSPPTGPRLMRPMSILSEWASHLRPTPAPAPIGTGSIAPPIPNVTAEPPIVKRPVVSIPTVPDPTPPALLVPPPTPTPAISLDPPPLPPAVAKPDYVPTLPPFMPDLPPIVTPPDPPTATAPKPVPVIPPTLPPPPPR